MLKLLATKSVLPLVQQTFTNEWVYELLFTYSGRLLIKHRESKQILTCSHRERNVAVWLHCQRWLHRLFGSQKVENMTAGKICILHKKICIQQVCLNGRQLKKGQKGQTLAVASLCSVLSAWQSELSAQVTQARYSNPPPRPAYTQSSISSSYLLPGRYSECMWVCVFVCLRALWVQLILPSHTDSRINSYSRLMDCRTTDQLFFSSVCVCAWWCMLSHRKLYFYEPQMSDTHCAHVSWEYVCIVCVRVCVLYMRQCNLPEAGMWVNLAPALQGETAERCCLYTYWGGGMPE